MKWYKKHKRILLEIICLLFTVLFVYAAVSKFLDFEQFKIQLGQSPMLTGFAGWLAWGIPILELLIAVMLTLSRLRRIALYACLGLMTMFSMYIIAILNFSDFVPCSCGGILERMGWTEHLIFHLVFVFLAAIAILLESNTTTNQEKDIKQYIKT